MPVAVARIRVAFDQRRFRHRHRPRIALRTVSRERDVRKRSATTNDEIRKPNALPVIQSRAKVGMQRRRRANEIDNRRRVRIDRSTRNVLIPRAVRGERNKSIQARALPKAHAAATLALRRKKRRKTHYKGCNQKSKALHAGLPKEGITLRPA